MESSFSSSLRKEKFKCQKTSLKTKLLKGHINTSHSKTSVHLFVFHTAYCRLYSRYVCCISGELWLENLPVSGRA